MDLILVMKERLRDQNLEIRSVFRSFLLLTGCAFMALVVAAYFLPVENRSPLTNSTPAGVYLWYFFATTIANVLFALALKTMAYQRSVSQQSVYGTTYSSPVSFRPPLLRGGGVSGSTLGLGNCYVAVYGASVVLVQCSALFLWPAGASYVLQVVQLLLYFYRVQCFWSTNATANMTA